MDLSRSSSSHSPNQPTTLNPLEISELDNDTASISSIQLSFEDIAPILPSASSFRRDLSNASARTRTQEPLPPSRPLPHPSRGDFFKSQSEHRIPTISHIISSATNLGTDVLRRNASERLSKRNRAVYLDLELDGPNGLHNAKVSARAMDRAMRRVERRRADPISTKPRPQVPAQVPARRHTDAQQSNAVRPSLRRDQDFTSLPPTRLNANEATRSRCMPRIPLFRRSTRDKARMASQFKNIEAQDQVTQQRVLADHMDKIFGVVPPPLSEGPRREVRFVVESGRKERGFAVRFGEAGAEDEMKELSKDSGLWERVKERVKSWQQRRGV